MTDNSDEQIVAEPHDEDPELLIGDTMDPEHDLDPSTFQTEPDEFEGDEV